MRALFFIATASASLISAAQLGQEHRFLYPAFGSGVAIHDMDGDGDGDVIRIVNNELWLIEQTAPNIYRTTRDLGAVGNTTNIHFADVDGDGIQDVVFGTNKWIRILGGGNYIAPQQLLPGSPSTIDIRLADMDGDLDLDAICSYTSGTANIGWAENVGGGSFGAVQWIYQTGGPSTTFDVADIDQDGDQDFAVAFPTLQWFENVGGGSFTAHMVDSGTDFYDVHLADVNGDQAPDLLSNNSYNLGGPYWIYRYTNSGGGVFGAATVAAFTGNVGAAEMRIIDHDDDGDLDLYYGTGTNIGVPASVQCMKNDGTGIFVANGPSCLFTNQIYPFDVGDLDGDTLSDIVGSDASGLYALVTGGGGAIRLTSVPTSSNILASDLDNDGDVDVALSHMEYAGMWQDVPAPLRLAYHANDSNGNMSETPVQIVQAFTGAELTSSCDVDGDGDQDLVARWFWSGDNPGPMMVLKNMGGGQFDSTGTIGTIDLVPWISPPSKPIIMRDMDQDGDPDAVLLIWNGPVQAQVCKNDGNGNFDAGQFYTLSQANAITLCDVDADGDADLVWSNANTVGPDSLFWNANDGNGVLGSSQFIGFSPDTIIPFETQPSILSADLDGDSLEDLVLFNGPLIGVMRNLGGAFSPGSCFPSTGIVTYDVGDMDGDSLTDIVALRANHDIVMWRNLGGVTFGAPILLATAPQSTGSSDLTLADIDGDGRLDVLTCSTEGSAAWLGNEIACDLFTVHATWAGPDLLQATPGEHYQWFLNGDSIANADQQTLITTLPGDYTVEVTSIFGCTATSDPYTVIALGVQDVGPSHFAIAPNPSSGDVRFISCDVISVTDALEIADLTGRVVSTMHGNGTHEVIIERGDLRAGIYLVRILRSGMQQGTLRMVLE